MRTISGGQSDSTLMVRCKTSIITHRLEVLDLSEDASRKLIEGYANTQRFSDGEIFWKIRFYHRARDARAEQKWWARLTETKRKDLKQLLKNDLFTNAFDDLLEMPGLWQPIKLGTLHRLLALKCHEVQVYLEILRGPRELISVAGDAELFTSYLSDRE